MLFDSFTFNFINFDFEYDYSYVYYGYAIYLLLYNFFNFKEIVILPNRFLFRSFFARIKVFINWYHHNGFIKKRFLKLRLKKTQLLRWKPLFKKSSYFFLYRSNKNRHLNK